MAVTMNLKLVTGVLASSIIPLVTYIISTIVAHAQFSDNVKDVDNKLTLLAIVFTSSYLTFPLFIAFLAVVILAALNIIKNNVLIIVFTIIDGAVTLTAGAGLGMSVGVAASNGAGVGMFVGVVVLLLVKIFPILPLTFEMMTKGITVKTGNEDSKVQKYLPFVVYGAIVVGFIFSLIYTGAALAVTIVLYEKGLNASFELFQYTLPLFIFLQMAVAMFVFVQFKWKWGARTYAVLSIFLLIILGYALNIMVGSMYVYNEFDGDPGYLVRVEYRGNISMTVASVFMILITIFLNMTWPVLYNLHNPNEEEDIPLLNQ